MLQSPFSGYPQNLSGEETSNPYLVITSFFVDFGLSHTKKTIARWMEAVNEQAAWNNGSPDNLLFYYEKIGQLIEAAWLINQADNTERLANLAVESEEKEINLMDPALYCGAKKFDSPWDQFPRSLSRKEFIRPYKVFRKFFKFLPLDEWKEELNATLHIALSNESMEDTGGTIDLMGIKKHLDKLVDACHLISVREFVWRDGEAILKTPNTGNNEEKTVAKRS